MKWVIDVCLTLTGLHGDGGAWFSRVVYTSRVHWSITRWKPLWCGPHQFSSDTGCFIFLFLFYFTFPKSNPRPPQDFYWLAVWIWFLQNMMNPLYSQPFGHYNSQPVNMQQPPPPPQGQGQGHYNGWGMTGIPAKGCSHPATWLLPPLCSQTIYLLLPLKYNLSLTNKRDVYQWTMEDMMMIFDGKTWWQIMGWVEEDTEKKRKTSKERLGKMNVIWPGFVVWRVCIFVEERKAKSIDCTHTYIYI